MKKIKLWRIIDATGKTLFYHAHKPTAKRLAERLGAKVEKVKR